MEASTRENTLYLPIKQIYFDQIIAGTKKEEYREIKDTTYKKYLDNADGYLDYNGDLIAKDNEMLGDTMAYNGGKFPYYATEYKYLSLAVGYNKKRDTALVEVTGTSFRVMKNKKGEEIIFDIDEKGNPILNSSGKYCFWEIVYHLGAVVEVHRKDE